jgi:uncharacterized protein
VVLEHTPTPSPDNSLTGQPPAGPVRTCVGCRARAAKSELLRFVIGSDESGQLAITPDPDGIATGRGAYLHRETACYDLAVRRRAFSRALRAEAGLGSTAVGEFIATLVT